ncbi:hypothetical protein JHL21_06340 [Devosia sp. WQ 349]|uniref:hypothetical protein n=1 Tax=Devosia sp. WQ 349K1 TaxID=2800329 RepID=UPI0019037C38|nr:hypothetical protein [Devosia sp. WQ 349K1]MBK1794115.1 hypothetical protein [Devosia sp. WQ 349K1]
MMKTTLALALVAATALATPVFAQEAANALRFADIDAERVNATQVEFVIEYKNGGCDQIGVPTLGALTNGVLEVQLAVSGESPNCTTRDKEGDVTYVIEADETITQLNVTLTSADGKVLGSEVVTIDR